MNDTPGYTFCPCCGDWETIDHDLCAYCEEAGCTLDTTECQQTPEEETENV